jgi:hypothetical protein
VRIYNEIRMEHPEMAQLSAFEQLVRSLSSSERRELLAKIEASFSASPEPLRRATEEDGEILDVEYEIRKMGLLQRLVFYLIVFFTNRSKISLMRELLLGRVRRRINIQCPGLVDFRNSFFKERMYSELALLMEGARYFQPSLRQAMETSRTDFFAFLVGMEVEDIQERIDSELIPLLHVEDFELDDVEISKKDIVERFDDIAEEIPGEDRTGIYRDAQALFGLYNLSRFHFNDALSCFKESRFQPGKECEFQALSSYLVRLCELLAAAEYSPSACALRALFLFFYRDRLEEEEFEMEEQLYTALSESEGALARIREFNEHVPLLLVIKYITHDLDFRSRVAGGAEDWFFAFRDFWLKRIDKSYNEFALRKKRRRLIESATAFLGVEEIKELGKDKSWDSGGIIKIKYGLSLSFLKEFASIVFRKASRALSVIYLNGEFYKEQNRKEFTDAYEFLSRLEEKISLLEKRLSPRGDVSKQIGDVHGETATVKQKNEKIQSVLAEFDRESLSFVEESIKELNSLNLLLSGILHGEPGARFDTLSNFGSLGGRNNRILVTTWERALNNFSEALNLLIDIKEVESKWNA